MIELIAKWAVLPFGVFFVSVGLIMLFKPQKARQILRKAGSTNFIIYAEITLRMVPATAFIVAADQSNYPMGFKVFGWFMLITSHLLYFVPRQIHHNYSIKAANILKPFYFQLIAPFAFAIGILIIYGVL